MHPNVKKLMILGGGRIFTPDRLPGLAAWYSADHGVLTSVGPDVSATDGQTVRRWLDRSGNGRHLEQATLANQPTFTGGQLKFEVGDVLASSNASISQPLTIFAVATSYRTGAGDGNIVGQFPSSTVGRWLIYFNGAVNRDLYVQRTTGAETVRIAGQTSGKKEVLCGQIITSSGSGTALLSAGATEYSSAVGSGSGGSGATPSTPINMYGATNGYHTTEEAIICEGLLDAAIIAKVVRSLARKWGASI